MTDDKSALLALAEAWVAAAKEAEHCIYKDGVHTADVVRGYERAFRAAIAALSPRTEGWVMVPRELIARVLPPDDGSARDDDEIAPVRRWRVWRELAACAAAPAEEKR